MALKGTVTLFMRVSRAIISRPIKPLVPARNSDFPVTNKHFELVTKQSKDYHSFSSIYRSIFSSNNSYQYALTNLIPFRNILGEIKRRLFFAASSNNRLFLSLFGFILLPESSSNRNLFDESLIKISQLLSKTFNVDNIIENNQLYKRASLNDFELGRLLGCGCNAAVYEARLRSTTLSSSFVQINDRDDSDIEILSNSTSDDENHDHIDEEDRLNELTLKEVRYRAANNIIVSQRSESNILPTGQFNLAIKILYNYGIQSNAEALEKAMEKELLPLRKCFHPNIVRMYSSFVDSFPLLKEAHEHYPMAIPSSLSPDSCGRNKTLFIVMKRYDVTLSEYLRLNKPDRDERLLLLAQLLEALLYLQRNSIVHRDLKSDNLLICNETGELVLTDFGCALHQPPNLRVPYVTDEISKGGNLALMAPEIVSCQAGPKSILDYGKADLWACGTLTYELFSQPNPFFHGTFRQETYDEKQLPSLSLDTTPIIEQLVFAMLRKNPKERPTVSLIADCVHIYLWLKSNPFLIDKNELYQNYMWTALETLFQKRRLSFVELNLKKLFFERQCSKSLYHAQSFLHRLSANISNKSMSN